MNRFKNKQYFFLGLILLLSLFIRFAFLGPIPPALYTDEVDQGYNAYSILKTGRDEHGIFLPVSLRSFGDWKPPLPSYLMIPSIMLLGLTEEAVRLPSAIAGIGIIFITFYLSKELFKDSSSRVKISLIASFLLAVSPYHILESRAAMLVITALFFLELAIFLFLKSPRKPKLLILSSASFALTFYSYYGLRLTTPLIIFALFIFYRKFLFRQKIVTVISIFTGLIILSPLILGFINQPDVLFGRAKTISVFYDQGISLTQKELITQEYPTQSPLLTRFFHNKLYMYSRNILSRYLSHLDINYLFTTGDKANPFQLPSMGLFYPPEALFLLLGFIALIKLNKTPKFIILIWLSIGILPGALTFITPASNRTFNIIIPLTLLIALGINYLFQKINRHFFLSFILTVIYMISIYSFLYKYFIIIPKDYYQWWSYNQSQLGKYIAGLKSKPKNIIIFDQTTMIYPYILFYEKYDPVAFQKEAQRSYLSDQSGFEHVTDFGRYIFYSDQNWQDIKQSMIPDSIYIVPKEFTGEKDYGSDIIFPNGTKVYQLIYNP